jgi:SAM-dependent methyltransferase
MYIADKDPVGQAVLDYYKGDHSAKITVRSTIAEDDVLPVEYLFRSYPELPEREVKALGFSRGKVLDVGAGAGAHALILQERGLEVEAIDVSSGAVEVMKARGLRSVRQINVFDLEEGAFDTILMLMNGIGIVGNLEGLDRFLLQTQNLLAPQGQLLVESSDILYMYEEEDGSVLLNLNGGYYGEVEYRMEYRGIEGAPFNWLFVDFLTLQDHAHTLGYGCECLVEDEQGHYLARLTLTRRIHPGR